MTAPRHWSFILKSDPSQLRPMREDLGRFLAASGLSEEDQSKIQVVLGEACTNAIRHSYNGETNHEIKLEASDLTDKITFKIRDWGKKIDLSKIKPPCLPPETSGGLGVYFMQTLMDEIYYETKHAEGN